MIHGKDDLRVQPDTEIWREGEIGRFLVLIMQGEVECTVVGEGGGFRAGPGYVLGADATFGSIPYAYSARSVTPVVALQIDAAVLTDIKEDHFGFALSTLSHFAREEIRLLECKASIEGAH
jgi:CRP-like cAMP-binding protein